VTATTPSQPRQSIRRSLVRAQNSLVDLIDDVATLNAKVDARMMAMMQSTR